VGHSDGSSGSQWGGMPCDVGWPEQSSLGTTARTAG
jgi:hypothetical protein